MCCIPKRGGGAQYVKQGVLTSYHHLNIVGCLLKKAYKGEVTGTPESPLPPSCALGKDHLVVRET